MGMRVKKMVGWGTNDFVVKDKEAFEERQENLYELSAKEWLVWLSCREDDIVKLAVELGIPNATRPTIGTRHIRKWVKNDADPPQLARPGWCYSYDDEFGPANTIIFWPFHMAHKCHRSDDLIDWFEESGDLENSVRYREGSRCVYPYDFGEIPQSVIGTCIFLGIEDVIPKLKEALVVYWS